MFLKRGITVLAALLLLVMAVSCDFIDLGGFFLADSDVDDRFDWSRKQPPPPPVTVTGNTFSFLAVTDTHYYRQTDSQPHFAELAAAVEGGDLFLVVDGDLMQSGSADSHQLCLSDIQSVGLPFYPAVGNHDIYNDGWNLYRSTFGPSVYSLDCGDLRLICLDSANGTLGGSQYRWLQTELAAAPEPFTLVITHANFFAAGPAALQQFTDYEEQYALMSLFERCGVDLVISGHAHYQDDRTINGVRYVTLETFHVTETPRVWYRFNVSPAGIELERHGL
jgi:3',5'-cyclic AMP phosphodiesterase CpdA